MARLTEERIQQIEALTHDVRQASNQNGAYVNLSQVASHFGIATKVGPFDNPEISGAYDREEKVIYVSDQDTPERQVFTIAHELGHFFLHKDKKGEVFYRTTQLNLDIQDDIEETEANWFAASLLMPKEYVLFLWKEAQDLKFIAEAFGVSQTAAWFRIKNLGLLT